MTTLPVGLARDLPALRVMRAQVGDTDLAIWRSATGRLSAWGNRCPHRGMRLSHGFVRGEALACLYHGWHYGKEGLCSFIPAHPELEPPKTIRPEIFDIVEAGGVLWVSTDGAAVPTEMTSGLRPVRSLTFEAEPAAVRAACLTIPLPDCFPARRSTNDTPAGVIFRNADDEVSFLLLFQPLAEARMTAHVLARNDSPAGHLIDLSHWCEAVRRQAEKESA